jgi:cyclophilin family peptidyl-prolyl cis-trans isomerase
MAWGAVPRSITMQLSNFGRSSRGTLDGLSRAAGASHALEALESRTLLSDTPLPLITDLESPNNSVIRFETTLGDIDIEMFADAPLTVANFMNNYVVTGKLDLTFFHRETETSTSGIAVLQGGGFYFDDVAGVSEVDTVAPVVLETAATRPNAQRTLSMARTNALNSGTSQFFINVQDNSADLPPASANGYAVFGRVIQGWNVVLAMANYNPTDIRSDAPISGPLAGTFGETPTGPTYNPADDRVREEDLLFIINAEVIKPAGANDFYNQRLVFPEGNATAWSTETINLHNPNAATVTYQLIARYEYLHREEVIATGTIPANRTLAIPLSLASDPTDNLVRTNSPYALVLETSVPQGTANVRPVVASATRNDFRATTSEEFFNVTGVADATLRTWDFAYVERNRLSKEFITWLNLSDTTANITLTFYRAGAAPITANYTTEAFRRGGAEVFNLLNGTVVLPGGTYGVRVTSSQNLVVQLSDWDIAETGENPAIVYTPGWSAIGTPGGTSTGGAFIDVLVQDTNNTSLLSFVNPGSTAAVITLSIWRTSRPNGSAPIQRIVTPIATAQGRSDYVLTTAITGIPVGERFTVTYSSGAAPVAAQYTNLSDTDRNLESPAISDSGISMSAITSTASAIGFSNASLDPTRTDGSDVSVFSLFNPFAAATMTFTYTLDAYFSDGTTISVSAGSLTPNARLDIRLDQNSAIRAKAASALNFRTYSLVLRGTGTQGSTTHNIAGFAQLTRRDAILGTSMTTQGTLLGPAVSTSSSIFLP